MSLEAVDRWAERAIDGMGQKTFRPSSDRVPQQLIGCMRKSFAPASFAKCRSCLPFALSRPVSGLHQILSRIAVDFSPGRLVDYLGKIAKMGKGDAYRRFRRSGIGNLGDRSFCSRKARQHENRIHDR